MSFEPYEIRALHGGVKKVYRFANGYGASVIRHEYSYGGDEGLYELGVTGPDDRLCYTTPITDDVIGYLAENEVDALLEQINALPEYA